MGTFIIIPIDGTTTEIDQTLPQFGNKALRLPTGQWLVAYDGTSRQLSDEVGISESSGSALVLNFSAYWGRAGKDIWEWIAANGGA